VSFIGKKQLKKGSTNNSGVSINLPSYFTHIYALQRTVSHASVKRASKSFVTSPTSGSNMNESDNYTDLDSSISEYASAVEDEGEHNEVAMQLDPVMEEIVGFFFPCPLHTNNILTPTERRRHATSRTISRNCHFVCDPHAISWSHVTIHFDGDNAGPILRASANGKNSIPEFLATTSHLRQLIPNPECGIHASSGSRFHSVSLTVTLYRQ